MLISNRPETFLVQVLTRNFSWGLLNWVAFVFVWSPRPLDRHWSPKAFNSPLLETQLFYFLPFLLKKKKNHLPISAGRGSSFQISSSSLLSVPFSKPCLFRELSGSFCLYLETQRRAWPGVSVWGGRDAVTQIQQALSAADTCCLRCFPGPLTTSIRRVCPQFLPWASSLPFVLGSFKSLVEEGSEAPRSCVGSAQPWVSNAWPERSSDGEISPWRPFRLLNGRLQQFWSSV